MMGLLAIRAIDLAIFGTLGGLWVFGAAFIYVLYRWIARYERENGVDGGASAQSAKVAKPAVVHEPRRRELTVGAPARA